MFSDWAFQVAAHQAYERQTVLEPIVNAIKQGMAPFNPIDIAITTTNDLVANGMMIYIYVRSLPDYEVRIPVDFAYVVNERPEHLANWIAEQAVPYFTKRLAEPEDNIELGEY